MSTEKVKPGEVIGSALEIYREQAGVLLPAAIAVFAIVAIARLVLTGGAAALVSLIALVIGTFYQGMVVELVRDIQDGHRDSSVEQLFRSVAPIVLPLIGLSILLAIGVGIGFILIIVPGLFLMTIWSVAAPSLVIERHGVFAAFGRSRACAWPRLAGLRRDPRRDSAEHPHLDRHRHPRLGPRHRGHRARPVGSRHIAGALHGPDRRSPLLLTAPSSRRDDAHRGAERARLGRGR